MLQSEHRKNTEVTNRYEIFTKLVDFWDNNIGSDKHNGLVNFIQLAQSVLGYEESHVRRLRREYREAGILVTKTTEKQELKKGYS